MLIEQELTLAQLMDAYQSGQREFKGIEIVGDGDHPSVSNVDLGGAEFLDCWFHSTTFVNVNLGGTKFTRCNLKCSTFEGCNLVGSIWSSCPVCSIAMANCNTTGIAVNHLNAYGAEIESVLMLLAYAAENFKGCQTQ
ncbi:pentapeptide repeat-containing protein [Piscinibacter terrae]|uniref:Pentapeptide repeat-containing protein n=1 Tax=Piscinibacter terrae TaxID=2496871 RepID=A0A3N7HHB9_9BURK|nr:pentapeptide repeat-containing protein [Albitalea terrae]RQP21437.1 hypothetical protein DZC73_28595 [Albitalea terrae]